MQVFIVRTDRPAALYGTYGGERPEDRGCGGWGVSAYSFDDAWDRNAPPATTKPPYVPHYATLIIPGVTELPADVKEALTLREDPGDRPVNGLDVYKMVDDGVAVETHVYEYEWTGPTTEAINTYVFPIIYTGERRKTIQPADEIKPAFKRRLART